MAKTAGWKLGNRIAPPQFLLFVAILVVAGAGAAALTDWLRGVMIGFDAVNIGVLAFTINVLGG